MIGIINVDPEPRKKGPHIYEVRINREHICYFVHRREESLDVCLRRASNAVANSIRKAKKKPPS